MQCRNADRLDFYLCVASSASTTSDYTTTQVYRGNCFYLCFHDVQSDMDS